LLIHASVHDLHMDDATMCEFCLVADNLDSSLITGQFEFAVQSLTCFIKILLFITYLSVFCAQSPLPRAPPHSLISQL
jgi:hypothetical protein